MNLADCRRLGQGERDGLPGEVGAAREQSKITATAPCVRLTQDVAAIASATETSLTSAISSLESGDNTHVGHLVTTRGHFMDMEGKLSIGSRAAFGELSGQLRVFIAAASEGESVDSSALGLFTARTLFFLANELSVPGPNFG